MGLLAAICAAGQGERIIAGTIVERLTLTSSGAFEQLTPGQHQGGAKIRTHAGMARVLRYRFTIA